MIKAKIFLSLHRISTSEINKIPLFWFDDKMYIQNNGSYGLALGY